MIRARSLSSKPILIELGPPGGGVPCSRNSAVSYSEGKAGSAAGSAVTNSVFDSFHFNW